MVARGRILTTVAVVAPINVEPMRPAVFSIGMPFLRGIEGGGGVIGPCLERGWVAGWGGWCGGRGDEWVG